MSAYIAGALSPNQGESMTAQSPKRPYDLATARGVIRIWGAEGEGGGEGQQGAEGAEQEQELTPEQKAIKEAQDKADEATKKAADAEKKAKDAEKKLADKEREALDDNERTAAERDDFKEKYEKLLKIVETSFLDTAIMKDKNLKFRDSEGPRAFLDREKISVDLDTGEVTGLADELKRIAKEKPYLLVPKEGEGAPGGQQQQQPPPSGPPTGGHPQGGNIRQRETDRNKLGVKYNIPGFRGATNVSNARPL